MSAEVTMRTWGDLITLYKADGSARWGFLDGDGQRARKGPRIALRGRPGDPCGRSTMSWTHRCQYPNTFTGCEVFVVVLSPTWP